MTIINKAFLFFLSFFMLLASGRCEFNKTNENFGILKKLSYALNSSPFKAGNLAHFNQSINIISHKNYDEKNHKTQFFKQYQPPKMSIFQKSLVKPGYSKVQSPKQSYNSNGVPISMNEVTPTFPSSPFNFDGCRNQPEGRKLSNPLNSGQFFVCHNNKVTVMDCPMHLVFNPYLDRCDHHETYSMGCLSNPCLNNGKCVPVNQIQHKCECAPGFSGETCGVKDKCEASLCAPNGVCLDTAVGSVISHLCLCSNSQTLGFDCFRSGEPNPCMQIEANNRLFSTKFSPSIYIHCQGKRPHIKFCHHPLEFSPSKGHCDWARK